MRLPEAAAARRRRGGRALPHGAGGRGVHRGPARAAGTGSTTGCPGLRDGHRARAARRALARRLRRPLPATRTLDYDEAAILAEGERAAALWAPEQAERVMTGCAAGCARCGGRRGACEARDARRSPAPSPRSCSCTKGSARSRCGATSRRGWRRDRPARADLLARGPRVHPTSRTTPRTPRFMHEEALDVLPAAAAEHGIERAGARRPQRRRLDRAHPRVPAPGQRARPARAARVRRGRQRGQHRRGARDVRDHRPGRAHGPLPPRRRAHVPALERHLARARVPRLEHRGRAAAA